MIVNMLILKAFDTKTSSNVHQQTMLKIHMINIQ